MTLLKAMQVLVRSMLSAVSVLEAKFEFATDPTESLMLFEYTSKIKRNLLESKSLWLWLCYCASQDTGTQKVRRMFGRDACFCSHAWLRHTEERK